MVRPRRSAGSLFQNDLGGEPPAAALLGMDCVVFMGEEDTLRQALNVYRMNKKFITVVGKHIHRAFVKYSVCKGLPPVSDYVVFIIFFSAGKVEYKTLFTNCF